MRLYESRVLGKEAIVSSQVDRGVSSSNLRDKDCDNKSILNSFIIKKESIVTREKESKCTSEILRNINADLTPTDNGNKPTERQTTLKVRSKECLQPNTPTPELVVDFEKTSLESPTEFGTERQEDPPGESTEVNIKISILNMNNPCLKSAGKVDPETSQHRDSPAQCESPSEPSAPNIRQFARFDLIEEFLLEDTLADSLFGPLTESLAEKDQPERQRIPKLDIGSLEEKGLYDLKERAETEVVSVTNLEGSSQTIEMNVPSLTRAEDQHMLTMMKENSNYERVVAGNDKSGEEGEEVIYAIRTNIETIVEYSDLLIKIISEEFMDEVLATINRFHADRSRIDSLIEHEYQAGGWDSEFLHRMGFEPDYISQVCLNLNRENANTKSRLASPGESLKENQERGNQAGKVTSDKRSTKAQESSGQSKSQLKTISNIDNFATLRSWSEAKRGRAWDLPVKPYCVLGKNVFLRLTDKILSSYAEANIQENLFDIQKVFHRSIFDSFNESLTEYVFRTKKYNIFLEEILILKKPRFDIEDLSFFLAKAKFILIEKASEMVGFLLNKEDSELGRPHQTTSPRT